ncbi:MAG: amino acid adenylation domain-containing protein [Candidatus Aminicenantes bacterium]|jgi:amino acid adenylation domain-containing protein/non-ribosomal peptide synthase protein (TIGR01720 family)
MKKLNKKNIEDILELTPMQEGLLFHYLKAPVSENYSEQLNLEISGKIDKELFINTWNMVIETNEMLRTVFRWEKVENPIQIILKERPFQPVYHDLSDKGFKERKDIEGMLAEIKSKDKKQKFDLREIPFRVTLCKVEDDRYVMIISNHHILYDGWSNGIILKEFFETYRGLSNGGKLLKPVKSRFKEFIKWNRDRRGGTDPDQSANFWRSYLKGFDTQVELSIKKSKNRKETTATGNYRIGLASNRIELEDFCKKQKITLASLLYSAWGLLLHQYNNRNDAIFGSTVSGRTAKVQGIENMVGLFINTLPLRIQTNANEKIGNLLCRINDTLKMREAHENTPLLEIKECSEIDNNEELFDSIVIIENYPLDISEIAGNGQLSLKSYSMDEATHYDLTLAITIFDDIKLIFTYKKEIFDKNAVARLATHFRRIVENIIRNPGERVADIKIISGEDQQQILLEFNRTEADYPQNKTLHQLFAEQVEKKPDQMAVIGCVKEKPTRVTGEQHLSYRQLNEKSNQVARFLKEKGVGANRIVGVMIERSPLMMVGLMAILKSGGAYLPINPQYPEDRINYILEDAQVEILIKTSSNFGFSQKGQQERGLLVLNIEDLEFGLVSNFQFRILDLKSSNLAYVIYTSGSTGKPKGVMVEHHSVVNRLNWMQKKYPITGRDVILQKTPITFDVSVWELFWWAIEGARVYLPAPGTEKDPAQIVEVIEKNSVTLLHFVPSMLRSFLESIKDVVDTLKLSGLSRVFASGEELPLALVNRFNELLYEGHGVCLANLYGPTEATVDVSYFDCSTGEEFSLIPIGKPIDNIKLLVMSENEQLQPIGIPGELRISGKGLARGYLNRPELTREKFIETSLPIDGRLYRTGDLARWLTNGNIEFLGRIDHQVKIRGFRIELGEIEKQMLNHEDVKEAVVITRDDERSERCLCAYLVPHSPETFQIQKLSSYLQGKLPDHMIPGYFSFMEKIPLTPSGKLDRRSLPAPELISTNEYIAPRNEMEKLLVEVWDRVLAMDGSRIGVTDNFYQLGGHSLKAIKLAAKIREKTGVEMSLPTLLSHLTVEQCARYLDSQLANGASSAVGAGMGIEYPAKVQDLENLHHPFPLTPIQAAYLMGRGDQFDIGSVSTHFYLEVNTQLDARRFNESFNNVIARHPMLRTVVSEDGKQRILEEIPRYEITVEDLTHLGANQQNERIMKERERMSHHIFDLSRWPLFEIKAFRLSKNDLYLFLGFDVLILDAHSFELMAEELMVFYRNPGLELAALEFTFRDYILGVEEFRNSNVYAADREYWLSKLEDFPSAPQLPLACKPAEIKKTIFNRRQALFSKQEWETLQRVGRENNLTTSILLCTAYAQVLGYWSNQKQFAINVTIFNRYPFHKDVNKILGNFTSVVLLHVDWNPDATFMEMAANLQQRLMEALQHKHYEGVEFIRDISRHNHLITQAVMPVVFNSTLYENDEVNFDFWEELADVRMTMVQTSQVFIDNHAYMQGNKLVLAWDYVEDLFAPCTIGTMFQQYTEIIRALMEGETNYHLQLSEPDQKLWALYNETAEDFPLLLLHQMFRQQREKRPENIALEADENTLNYKQLDIKSNQVAHHLKDQGIGRGDLVAIITSRSIETMVSVMGILKAGAAYVPIDPDYPEDRRTYIAENSNCRLLLEPGSYERKQMGRYPTTPLHIVNTLDDLGYVIYTSGSTGRPKGVVITHREAANTIIDINCKFNVNQTDRIMGISSMCFDLSVYDLFGALSTGARLVLIPTQKDVDVLIRTLDIKKITLWNSVPAIMDMVVQSLEQTYKHAHLRLALLSGDWIPLKLPENIRTFFPNCEVISLGGATEGSIWSIYYPIDEVKKDWKSIPYGYPLANQEFYVLNFQQQLCPVDVPGELYIGGVGVAEGYLHDEEKTRNAFLNHPELGKIYKTGDHGVFHREGYIEFLGRKDHQVKIRGYRVELGEIESCLLEHEAIKNAIVTDRTNASAAKYLCAYLLVDKDKDSQLSIQDLKAYLSQKLPDYMIPSFFEKMEEFPLTQNGKISYKNLPEPEGLDLEIGFQHVVPRNDMEQKMAEIWGTILKRNNIGITENFFMMGGDSIKSIQIASSLRRAGYEVDMKDIFQYPTISELVPHLRKKGHFTDQSLVTGTLPLTPIQKEFFRTVNIDRHHFNQAVMLHANREERFDPRTLERVFLKLQHHHDALRMTYYEENGEIIQLNNGLNHPLSLQEYDFRGQGGRENALAFEDAVNQIQSSIDLKAGPLMKLGLFHLDDGDRLLIVIHHLVIDGISWRILFEDIGTLFWQHKRGEQLVLPPKTHSFKYWSECLTQYANSETLLREKDYWVKLESRVIPAIEKDFHQDSNYVKDAENQSFLLNEEETGLLLEKVNKAFGTEINDIQLTALVLGIKETFAHEQVLLMLESHGREEIMENMDVKRTIGWYTCLYPVLLDASSGSCEDNLARLIKENKERLRRIPNKGIGYGILKYLTAEEFKREIQFKLNPQICFNYLGQFDADIERMPFTVARESYGNTRSIKGQREFELDVSGMIVDKQLNITVTYNRKHFKQETIRTFLANYKTALRRIISYCLSKKEKELTPSDLTYPGLSLGKVHQLVKQYPLEDIYPLSPMQEGKLFYTLYNDSFSAGMIQMITGISGALDLAIFRKSVNVLFECYDMLRAAFIYEEIKVPLQVILKERQVEFLYNDLRGIAENDTRKKAIEAFKEKDRQRSFNLMKDVLLRVAVLHTGDAAYEIIWSFHHIIMDGWCLGILFKDFLAIYHAFLENRPYQLPAITPYKKYIHWLNQQDEKKSRNYWAKYLEDYEQKTSIPKMKGINEEELEGYEYKRVSIAFNKTETRAMNNLAVRNQVTLNTVIQTIWAVILSKYNWAQEVVFGAVVSGRPSEIPGVESMVGLFMNTIPLRVSCKPGTTFKNLLRQVQEDTANSSAYHHYPLARIQADHQLKRNLLDHIIVFENYPLSDQLMENRRNAKQAFQVSYLSEFAQPDYNFHVVVLPGDSLRIEFRFNALVYDVNTVEKLSLHFEKVVDTIIENCGLKLEDIQFSHEQSPARLSNWSDYTDDFGF